MQFLKLKGEKSTAFKILKSRKGISPILATLLLIVIAVAAITVTYAWIMTYMGNTTEKAGFIPYEANVAFPTAGTITIDIGNSGTSSGQILQVYVGASESGLQSKTTVPATPITIASNEIKSFNVTYSWTSGTPVYFKVVPSSGAALSFNEAP